MESEWFWYQTVRNESEADYNCLKYQEDYFPPKWTYQDFGPQLTMEFFNASAFADLVYAAGAKYFVFTSKHHDGFCNWPSTYTYGWNSMAIGPERDVLRELKDAFDLMHPEIHFGFYYSLYEWFHPLYNKDKNSNWTYREYALNKMLPEMTELVNLYEPHIFWSDGDWEAQPEYFGSQEFLAWLYNDSPVKDVVVTNDRWGQGTGQTHGGFYSGPDRYNPGTLQAHKWENAMTVDIESWGYRRNAILSDILTPTEILSQLVTTVSCGGNILINVGPTKEGTISPIYEERIRQVGDWLSVNGEGIYSSIPWSYQNDTVNPDIWYTQNNQATIIYVHSIGWPANDILQIEAPLPNVIQGSTTISMLGVSGYLDYNIAGPGLQITMPSMSEVRRQCPLCNWVYVIKMENLIP